MLLCCIAVGVLSTALPFPLEQVALRRLGPDIFSLLACLMPAISEVVSMIGLRHLLNWGGNSGFTVHFLGSRFCAIPSRGVKQ